MPFSGKATTSGSSKVIAFEASLFRAHPEFATGRFSAHVIGPGALLVIPEGTPTPQEQAEPDPVLAAYLAFIERNMATRPDLIRPITTEMEQRHRALVEGVSCDPDEDLGPDATLP